MATAQSSEKPMLDYVVEQLGACRGSWMEIAHETGVAYHTLTKIAYQQNRDYGVRKIQALHDYFRARERKSNTIGAA